MKPQALQVEWNIKMAKPESKFTTEYGDPCTELRVMRVRYNGRQSDWAKVVGIDQPSLSKIERGENFPTRDKLLEWTQKWNVDQEDEDLLLISAGYVPRLPEGFGNREDFRKLSGAFKKLLGRLPKRDM